MKILLSTFLIFITIYSYAKKEAALNYPVSAIPAELKENAHAIIRNDETELNVIALNKVKYKRTITITLLDSKAEDYAVLACKYNMLQKINDITGKLYNEAGEQLKEMKERDALDVSTYGSNYVFHSDSRLKKFDFNYYKYPFTVSYTVEQTLNTTFFLPAWNVQPSYDCAVENSTFKLIYSDATPIRFKAYVMPSTLITSETREKDNHVIIWNLKNVRAKYYQPMSTSENYEGPTMVLSANKFDLLDHKGSLDSWKSFGQFIYDLNKDLDVLPEDKKATVKSLTEGLNNTYDKVQKLYKYMQETTRYVAIEYGIASWQTFDATNVAKNGYGDCKGLTNYLKALLKEAGINSYSTLVFAGSDDYFKLDESFPSNVFNHVILCVPDNKDTIWVECTSQQLSAGYLGDFTQGRKVLLTTENGGIICQTPTYDQNKNYISRKATLNFNPDATSQKISINNHYVGLMQDNLSNITKTESETKIKEMVNTKFPFASYYVEQYKYKYAGNPFLPEIEELVDVSVSGIITKTQKRTFINLGWMNNPMTTISQAQPRTAPFVLNESFRITDTVIVNIQEGTAIESIPEPLSLTFDFGSYKTKFEKSAGQVIFIRTYIQNKGTFKVSEYDNYLKMYNAVNAGKNNLNIVLLNKAS